MMPGFTTIVHPTMLHKVDILVLATKYLYLYDLTLQQSLPWLVYSQSLSIQHLQLDCKEGHKEGTLPLLCVFGFPFWTLDFKVTVTVKMGVTESSSSVLYLSELPHTGISEVHSR